MGKTVQQSGLFRKRGGTGARTTARARAQLRLRPVQRLAARATVFPADRRRPLLHVREDEPASRIWGGAAFDTVRVSAIRPTQL